MTLRHFLARLLLAAGIAAAIAATIAMRPAAAAALLKAEVVVTGDIVTLGDLFAGAGELAGVPVFRAPDPGIDGALPADAALAAAEKAGLAVSGIEAKTVRVVRASVPLETADFAALVARAAADRLAAEPDDVEIAFDGLVETVHASPSSPAPAYLVALSMQNASGRFSARIAVDTGSADVRTLELTGSATVTAEVIVAARAIARGDILTTADVTTTRMERRRAGEAATDPATVVGMAARRSIRAGQTIAALDVDAPKVIARNEVVTVVYERPGLVLTARGRALSDAAAGELVSVVNEQSRRTIQAVAVSPGTVRVEPAAPRLASLDGTAP